MRLQPRVLVLLLSFLIILPLPGSAQKESGNYDQNLFKEMKWRLVGPFRGGRVLAVTGVPGEPDLVYFGAVAGGVWRSIDDGAKWTPLFDSEPISSVGAIAVAESDHNVIYVGTGEACIRGNISYGDGVYKSTDRGKTWKNIGLRDTRHIGALIVHPKNPDIMFVAALGHAYGPNAERGIFRTTDGGKSWQKVVYKDERTGGIDVVFDPNNSNILYAALWQVLRTPWSLNSGGPGSGLYKSSDGGATWKRLEGHGLPEGILGRIGVSVSGADSERVYALIEAKQGGLYRSDDGGDNWTRVNDDERYRQRAWYFTHIFADPKSVDTVYVLNTGLFKSTDGGKTFTLLPAPHGDHHGLWIDPTNPDRLIDGNDGGATISLDGGRTWTTLNNQPTAQFYHITDDHQWPYYLYGTQQDNSSVAIATYDDSGVIGRWDWFDYGGETGFVAPDPSDPNVIYSGNEGSVFRFDKRTQQTQDVSVWPLDVAGHGAKELDYRFNWTSPLIISPNDPKTIYSADNRLFRSRDGGMHWEAISPDLTRNDKSKQQPSGGTITLDITSVEYYDTIFAAAESPRQKDLLWVGTDDGLIQLSRDGGKNWANVTPNSLPEWSTISLIEASPLDPGTAYVAVDRHKLDDFCPYILKTTDYGKTWTSITSGIPENYFVHAVREDRQRKNLLYAGTERGVFVSFDDGAHWQSLQLNLPNTPITDLVVHDNDLAVATNGRSFWVLDDLAPLRELNPQIAQASVHLYKPEPAIRLHFPEQVNRRQPVGQNPPSGAIIDYYFKTKPEGEVTLDILDSQEHLARHYSSKEKKIAEQPPEWPDQEKPKEVIPAEAGMNRFPWDLRYEPPVKIPNAFYSGIGPQGPLALPGIYQVKLTAGGQSQTQPLELRLDPRVKDVSMANLEKEFDLSMKIRDANNRLHVAVNQIRELRGDLDTMCKWAGDSQQAQPVIAAAKQLDQKMTPVEEELIQVKMKSSEGTLAFPNELNEALDSLSHIEDSADAAPTAQMYEVFDLLNRRLEAQLSKWQQIVAQDLPALNQLMHAHSMPALQAPSGIPGD
jgi:photosystem II stability/assembly factor-like uncharacterized protein